MLQVRNCMRGRLRLEKTTGLISAEKRARMCDWEKQLIGGR